MLRSFIILSFFIFTSLCHAHMSVVTSDSLRDADLLFVVNTKGNAITAVTEGLSQLPIDHVAIFFMEGEKGSLSVIQADYRGVRVCALDSLWAESKPMADSVPPFILVGRVSVPFNVEQSVKNAFSYLGRSYDFDYMPSDDEIYCSELVQKSYVASNGTPIFSTVPMTFRDANGCIPEFWEAHYKAKGIPVPEGEPGTNPGELSRRAEVKILGRLVLHHIRQ